MGICTSTLGILDPSRENAPEAEYKPFVFDTTIVPE